MSLETGMLIVSGLCIIGTYLLLLHTTDNENNRKWTRWIAVGMYTLLIIFLINSVDNGNKFNENYWNKRTSAEQHCVALFHRLAADDSIRLILSNENCYHAAQKKETIK